MRFLHDFEAGFTLLTYNLKVHFTFSVTSILAPPPAIRPHRPCKGASIVHFRA